MININEGELKKVVDSSFEDSISCVKTIRKNKSIKNYDMTGTVLKRRKATTLHYTSYVLERFQEKYPSIILENVFAEQCASGAYPLYHLEKFYQISLAMALYILDILEQCGRIPDAMPYLDIPEEMLNNLDLPDFYDPFYSHNLVKALVYIIQKRDDFKTDCQFYINEQSAKRQKPIAYQIPSQTDPTRWTCRDRFDAIISLIPAEILKTVSIHFEEVLWTFFDVLVKTINSYMKLEAEYREKADRLKRIFISNYNAFCGTNISSVELTDTCIKDLTMKLLSIDPNDYSAEQQLNLLQRLAQERFDADNKADEIEKKYRSLAGVAHIIAYEGFGDENICDLESLEEFWDVEVNDPFEMCFAYLYLVDSGDDLPWLYNPAIAVLMLSARKLPWTVYPGRLFAYEKYTGDYYDGDGDRSENTEADIVSHFNACTKESDNYKLFVLQNFCELDGQDDDSSPRRVNIAQIVYGLTNTLIPRQYDIFPGIHRDLIKEGANPEFAKALELYLHLAHQIVFPQCTLDYEDEMDTEACENVIQKLNQRVLQLETQIEKTKAENVSLNNELYALRREAKESKCKLERVNNEAKEQTQELANLRELIFRQANEHTVYKSDNSADIVFPFETKSRFAVFGGHETWLKAIRPMLPNVTFIPRGQLPNEDLIRGQDAIWIQANAIAHKDYYKIINVTRANHIPVYYFGFASAHKCAVQLVEVDKRD